MFGVQVGIKSKDARPLRLEGLGFSAGVRTLDSLGTKPKVV